MNTRGRSVAGVAAGALALLLFCGAARAQLAVPVFGQRWNACQDDLFGDARLPNPEYGAEVTSIAMVLRYYGVATDPGALDTWLTQQEVMPGEEGVWSMAGSKIGDVTPSRWDWQEGPADLSVINGALDAGFPVIAECRLPYNDPLGQKQFVVLTGRSGPTYSMNDPWYGDAGTFNDRYHDPARYIYGIRIYHGTPPPAASPRGFAPGSAAWWCDWEAQWNGWPLAFAPNAGSRDPWTWYDTLSGAAHSDRPHVGAIAVFQNAANGGVGGPSGHVAYVISVSADSNRFRVRQAGWPNPWPSEADFELASAGTVRLVDGKPADPPLRLRGFLSPSPPPANPQQATAPPPPGAGCSRRVLVISSNQHDAEWLKAKGFACDGMSVLPLSLDGYAAVWFLDRTAVASGIPEALEQFVEQGGGLVTSGATAYQLGKKSRNDRWMGLHNVGCCAFDAINMPDGGILFPPTLLGMDMGSDTRWVPSSSVSYTVIAMDYASGQSLVTLSTNCCDNVSICYTGLVGQGRFFFLSDAEDISRQPPVIQKALKAGLNWVMSR